MSKNKKLLIVEHCKHNLLTESVVEENGNESIILSGIFTTFDVKNRNNRIYESADVMPHIDALQEKISTHTLLGELDHPHGYDITLSNVSHVVESLEYDAQNNCIMGKVRLLNTSKGKEAQALVKDGIPLHISSRAAGTVDANGHVKMQQLFTYDLVADPGFANAQLKRVNESYGFDADDELGIFDLNPDVEAAAEEIVNDTKGVEGDVKTEEPEKIEAPKEIINKEDNNKNNKDMDNGQYILYSDFQKYTSYLSGIITDLQSAIDNYKTELVNLKAAQPTAPTQEFTSGELDNSQIEDMVTKGVEAKSAEIEEKYNNLKKYCEYLAENLDKSISHGDYLAENLENSINFSNYLAENLDKSIEYSNYLAEEQNKSISYAEYLAENLDKSIEYSNYLGENLDQTIGYQNYLAENLDKSIDYSNYLAEEQNKTISYNDYLAENMNLMVSHQDYLAEGLNKLNAGSNINENEEKKEKIDESVKAPTAAPQKLDDTKTYQQELSEKLNAILYTAKTQFEEVKKLEAQKLEESKQVTAESTEESKQVALVNAMPSFLKESWEKLSVERQREILNESKMFMLNTKAGIDSFWMSRDMRERRIENKTLNENKVAQPTPQTNDVMQSDYMKMLAEQIKYKMRGY